MQAAQNYHPSRAIRPLSRQLANQIAAGEVVERPASIVKELVENALDAGATCVDVELRKGGMQSIRVQDNGFGIRQDELVLAVSRHATSKITSLDELEHIISMGFRGEALASISSVSRMSITSQCTGAEQAWRLACHDGEQDIQPASHPPGTTLDVQELFYNTPARRRFLKSERTEFRHCEDVLRRIALSRFDVAFSLQHNQREVWRLPAATEDKQQARRLQKLCGAAFINQALKLDFSSGGLRLWGWLGLPEASRPQADLQYFFVNGRVIRDRLVSHALRQAFAERIYPGRYPAFVLYLELDPASVDVNVHPTKHEVRFREARMVHDFLQHCLQQVLNEEPVVPLVQPPVVGKDGHSAGVSVADREHAPAPAYYKPAAGNSSYRTRQVSAQVSTQVSTDHAVSSQIAESSISGNSSTISHEGQTSCAGQIVGTIQAHYLVVDVENETRLIDIRQVRAAQLQQQITDGLNGGTLKSRPVLIPYQLETDEQQLDAIETDTERWQRFGFELGRISHNTLIVRQVPAYMSRCDTKQAIQNLLAETGQNDEMADDAWVKILAETVSVAEPCKWSHTELVSIADAALLFQAEASGGKYWTALSPQHIQNLFK